MKTGLILVVAASLAGCATYRDVKEVKFVGFSDDVSKGKSVGQIESDDCVYQIMGYSLGDRPDLSKAIANARTRKKSKITDVAFESAREGRSLRYVTHLTTEHGGFDAVVFGKRCIKVQGGGYL